MQLIAALAPAVKDSSTVEEKQTELEQTTKMVQEANTDEPINTERDPQAKNQDHKHSQQPTRITSRASNQDTYRTRTSLHLIILLNLTRLLIYN